jgi:hypothetical protein
MLYVRSEWMADCPSQTAATEANATIPTTVRQQQHFGCKLVFSMR